MKKRLIFGVLLIIILLVGISSIMDNNDKWKVNNDFKANPNGWSYTSVDNIYRLEIINNSYINNDTSDWTNNDTDLQYSVTKAGTIYLFTDETNGEYGAFQICKDKNKDLFIIQVSTSNNGDWSKIKQYLDEFVSNNHLEVVKE